MDCMNPDNPDNPDNVRTTQPLSGDIPTRTDGTNAFRHVRPSGVRAAGPSGPPGGIKFFEVNPESLSLRRSEESGDTARCAARTRAGPPCRSLALLNGKCRVHGGLSPGAPRGDANGRYVDGYWTREAMEERRFIRLLLRNSLGGA